ncbi:MAG: hypothetical protein L3J41_17255, partial [Melioribacteraceae bacterium]|nr:hypothetical protein [Melioribacteraceae bacterium]
WSAYLLNAKLYNKYTDIFAYMQGLFVLNTFVFNNLTQFEETLSTMSQFGGCFINFDWLWASEMRSISYLLR